MQIRDGMFISCITSKRCSSFLEWALKHMTRLSHVVNDFLLAGKGDSRQCQLLLQAFWNLANELGSGVQENGHRSGTNWVLIEI